MMGLISDVDMSCQSFWMVGKQRVYVPSLSIGLETMELEMEKDGNR